MTGSRLDQDEKSAALSAFRKGSVLRAERMARRALRASPRDPDLLDVLWRSLAAQNKHAEAAEQLRRFMEAHDDSTPRRVELAKLLREAGKLEEAEQALREANQGAPGHPEPAYLLAYLLRDRGAWSEARGLIDSFAARRQDPAELFRAAVFLETVDGFREAEGHLERVLSRFPDDPKAHGMLAKVKESLGEFDAAQASYRRALEGQREFPGGWLRLTWLRKVTDPGDPDLERLEAVSTDRSLSLDCRACALFALGKAHDDLGEREKAFDYISRGNALWRQRVDWSPRDWDRYVTDVIAAFGGDWRPRPLEIEGGPRPVFIVGMMRSGTTLLERLLAERPGIVARGELTHLPNLLRRIPPEGYPASWQALPDADKRTLRERYLRQLVRDDSGGRAFIDKSPLNFRFLGAIAELFPDAVVIHTRRDARDVGLSLFNQPLGASVSAFSFDLEEIVHYYQGYLRLMEHWRSVLGERFLEVDYETLVSDPAPVVEQVAARLNPDAEASVEADTPAGIRTASVWQARQPVHRRSVGRWEAYRSLAPQFFEALGRLNPR